MKKILIGLLAIFVAFTAITSTAVAAVATSDTTVKLEKDEVIEDDYFIAGETVIIEGTVQGDVYAAGATVEVNGTIQGDLIAGAGLVNVSGTIGQDIIVAGGDVIVKDATVADGVTVLGGTVSIDETEIGGGLVFAAGTVDANADVTRGITGGSGMVSFEGTVGKDVLLGVDQLRIKSGTEIEGDLTYYSSIQGEIDSNAIINGNTEFVETNVGNDGETNLEGMFAGTAFGYRIGSYLAMLLVGLIILKFFGKHAQYIAEKIKDQPGSSFLWGLVLLFITPPTLFLIFITLVGIPLSLILVALYAIDLYISKIFTGIIIGSWIKETFNIQSENKYLNFALGLGALQLLTMIPVIGFFISTAAVMFGLGAMFIWGREMLSSGE